MASPRARWVTAAAVMLLAAGLAVWLGVRPDADEIAFAEDRLTVETATVSYDFAVELATTPEQHRQGLMYRAELAPDAGMLFVFTDEHEVSFWMKNTLIPLDLLFVDRKGRIVAIAADAVPLSTTPIPSGAPVLGVLEVPGGTAARLGIAVGDRVRHSSFSGQ